jgi:hypothetical protein
MSLGAWEKQALVSAGLITIALVLSRGGHSACTQSGGVCGG